LTLSILIAVALAIPTLLVVVLYAFSRSIPWFAARPRLHAVIEMIIGVVYVVGTLFETRDGFEASDVIPLILGIGFAAGGAYRWIRGTPVEFE